jgi:hypothetical protein
MGHRLLFFLFGSGKKHIQEGKVLGQSNDTRRDNDSFSAGRAGDGIKID